MNSPAVPAPRSSGVLLHPSSLPGPYGIGDLGPASYAWIDALVHAKQKWWQILPLGPTGYGDSPYQCFSAFAGNPFLISPRFLVDDGLLTEADLASAPFPAHRVDYGPVIDFKSRVLTQAWHNFQAGWAQHLRREFDAFLTQNGSWLEEYALFMALKDVQGGRSWQEWPEEFRLRHPDALTKARIDLAGRIGLHQFRQFLFFRQWQRVRDYAHQRGIRIVGDAPIFVASDSADVWANHELFLLDGERRPRVVAGVPPDYFSPTGQLWGNPLYNWEELRKTGYAWWIARLKATLNQVDLIRLDHFRGFEAYWEIPAGMPTAVVGQWVKGPGSSFLAAIQQALGGLPIIAEDLGLITPEVEDLRDSFRLPGMRILQFAFGGEIENRFLPHMYERHTIVYTGTHDNDTTWGWFSSIQDHERDFVRRYLARDGKDIAWDLMRAAWASVADYAIVPLQDILNLGTEGRMNYPGKPGGNWQWRFLPDQLSPWILDRLKQLTELYGR